MTEQEVKDMFSGYAASIFEVDALRSEHKTIEMRYAHSPFAAANQKEQKKRCERLCQKIIMRESQLIITRDRLENLMRYIKIPFGRAIIRRRYFMRESWQKVSFGVNYSLRQCFEIQNRAFKEISEATKKYKGQGRHSGACKSAKAKRSRVVDYS